jgi:hypothetical protein
MSSSPTVDATPAASFDNFYSPQNVSFYASKPYAPLNQTAREIRLIRILPGNDDDSLECELLSAQRLADVQSRYRALSYCAGDPKRTAPLTVSGRHFNAFASLGAALRQLRRLAEGEEQFFWIDQICINQSNPVERAHQVGFMREVYENAERVMVWLGDDGYGHLGLQWMKDQYCDMQVETEYFTYNTLAQYGYICDRVSRHLDGWLANSTFREHWSGLRELMFSPWWSRCWVAQELIVARNATVMYGNVSMLWHEFRVVYDLYSETFFKIIKLSSTIDNRNSQDMEKHWQESGGGLNPSVVFMVENKTASGTKDMIDIGKLLDYARYAQSSDPRDRIYALQGLAGSGYNIVPDYGISNTFEDTMCHAAQQIILNERSLRFLGWASLNDIPEEMDLPSWVPQWSSPSHRHSWNHTLYKASGSCSLDATFLPNPQGLNCRILRVYAVFIDQVAEEKQITHPDISLTPKGYLAVFNCDAVHTDSIVVLFGGALLFVIRKTGDQYRLVGAAFVEGFLDGEAIKMMDRGELEARYIDLI